MHFQHSEVPHDGHPADIGVSNSSSLSWKHERKADIFHDEDTIRV